MNGVSLFHEIHAELGMREQLAGTIFSLTLSLEFPAPMFGLGG